jgi:hypothetical protein
MSLQLLAKQMESKGRDGDAVLVHMTHGEVAGLQKLAESAGSSLSINPETGLVEANILESLLPTIIGGALMASGVGMPLAIAGGALVGGLQAKRDDRDFLTGALMGGMGAYGGAGLAGSLGAAGAANAGAAEMAKEATRQQALSQTANVAANIGGAAPTATQALNAYGLSAANSTLPAAASSTMGASAPSIMGTEAGAQAINNAYMKGAADYANKGFFARAGEGFSALGTQTGRDAAMAQAGGGKGLFRSGLAALSPAAAAMTPKPAESPYPLMSMDIDRNVKPFQDIQAYQAPKRSYNYQGNNVYIPTFSAADGGEVRFANGGGISDGSLLSSSAVANRPLIIDPATGNVIPNPNIQRRAPTFADIRSSGGSGEVFQAPNPDFDTPEKQAAYYAANPVAGAIGSISQSLVGMTPIGAMQNYFDPEGVAAREAMFQQAPAPVIDMSSRRTTAPVMEMSPEMRAAPVVDMSTARGPAPIESGPISRADYNQAGGYDPSSGQSYAESVGMGGDYAGSSMDQGDRGEAAGGLITLAAGGLMGLAKGGMRSGGFVIPADVVSMIGEGNTDAGYARIKSMVPGATAIKGKDGGQADTVKTSIEGKQPARVAHGEMYIPPETVERMGGAKKLYAMMDRVRQQATGSKKQIKPVSLKRAMA